MRRAALTLLFFALILTVLVMTFALLKGSAPEPTAPTTTTTSLKAISWGTPADKRVIEVVDKVKPGAWKVGKAVNWLDRYTASDMRLVKKCSGKAYRCITIRSGLVTKKQVGWSQGSTITIDTGKAMRKYGAFYRADRNRTWLITHELGHQFGLEHGAGRNVMNAAVNRYKMTLTSGQRAALAKR